MAKLTYEDDYGKVYSVEVPNGDACYYPTFIIEMIGPLSLAAGFQTETIDKYINYSDLVNGWS